MAKADKLGNLPSSFIEERKRSSRLRGFFRDARKLDRRPAELEYARPSKLLIQIVWKSCISYVLKSRYLRDLRTDVSLSFCEDELPEDSDDKHNSIEEAKKLD